jgi:GNAT superfamily N-acetyltransferase
MSLADGYHAISHTKLAAVVTSLEMKTKPNITPRPYQGPAKVVRQEQPTADWYRDLFERVGAPWLWTSRLKLSPAALLDIIRNPLVEVYALQVDGKNQGLLELDFREPAACELAFLGVTPSEIGSGVGRLLMTTAIERAFAHPIRRFWVHTCTLDHPAALAFYERSGFVPYQRQVEVFDDPRMIGILPPSAAPNVPRL